MAPAGDWDEIYEPPVDPSNPIERTTYVEVTYHTTNDDKRDDSIVETFVFGNAGEVIAQESIPYVKFTRMRVARM